MCLVQGVARQEAKQRHTKDKLQQGQQTNQHMDDSTGLLALHEAIVVEKRAGPGGVS